MTKTMLAVVLALGIVGCGDKPSGQDVLDDMTKLKNETCKCTDEACLATVREMADKMEDRWQAKYKDPKKEIGEAMMEKIDAVQDEAKACRRKMTGD